MLEKDKCAKQKRQWGVYSRTANAEQKKVNVSCQQLLQKPILSNGLHLFPSSDSKEPECKEITPDLDLNSLLAARLTLLELMAQ